MLLLAMSASAVSQGEVTGLSIDPGSLTMSHDAITDIIVNLTTVDDNGRQTVTPTTDVTWSSTSPEVAAVNSFGRLVAHAPGQTTLTATLASDSRWTAQCTVDVVPCTLEHGGQQAASLLREDLVWVNVAMPSTPEQHPSGLVFYKVKVEGDTIVEGMTYKKVYRKVFKSTTDETWTDDFLYAPQSVPVACLREEGGCVYRLCDFDSDNLFGYDRDDNSGLYRIYPHTANAGDSHYEVIVYDINNPDVYYDNPDGSTKFDRWFKQLDDVTVEGTPRKMYVSNLCYLIIEGLGAISEPAVDGYDMLCPGRGVISTSRHRGYTRGTYYIANRKGELLLYYSNNGFHPYDLNGDKQFDIDDLNAAINDILSGDAHANRFYIADPSFDGVIDIDDINMLINQLLYESHSIKIDDIEYTYLLDDYLR